MYRLGSNTVNGIKYPQNTMVMTTNGLTISIRMVGDDQVFAYGELIDFTQSDGTPFTTIAEFITFWNLNFNGAIETQFETGGVPQDSNITQVGGEAVPEVEGVPSIPVKIMGSEKSGGEISSNYKSPTDFTAAYTSSTTITLSALPFTITDSSQIVGIKVIPASGDAVVYKNGENGVTLRVSANVITISGVADPFTAGDVYEVGINSQEKAYDSTTDTIKVSPDSRVPKITTDLEVLVEAQDLTSSYADFGSEIYVGDTDTIGIRVIADVNDSEDVDLKVLCKDESGGSDEYDIDGVAVKSLWTTSVSDFKKYYEFEVRAVNYIQLQAIAGTVGATPGNLTIKVTKVL